MNDNKKLKGTETPRGVALHESCPDGVRCNHRSADYCKQARLVADHKQNCVKQICDCFSPTRGIPSAFRFPGKQ
jgi:hypothetical protein